MTILSGYYTVVRAVPIGPVLRRDFVSRIDFDVGSGLFNVSVGVCMFSGEPEDTAKNTPTTLPHSQPAKTAARCNKLQQYPLGLIAAI